MEWRWPVRRDSGKSRAEIIAAEEKQLDLAIRLPRRECFEAKVTMQALLRRHPGKKMQVLVYLLFVHVSMMPHRVDE